MNPDDLALQQRPNAFDGVRVNVSGVPDVLAHRMTNGQVHVILLEPLEHAVFVRHQDRIALHIRFDVIRRLAFLVDVLSREARHCAQ